jgi:hypothetical protein
MKKNRKKRSFLKRVKKPDTSFLHLQMSTPSTVTDICIQTLVSGHVASFSDFFTLVIIDKVIKPEEVEQLQTFQDLLRESENSKRSGSSKNVYLALTELANFFVKTQQVSFGTISNTTSTV